MDLRDCALFIQSLADHRTCQWSGDLSAAFSDQWRAVAMIGILAGAIQCPRISWLHSLGFLNPKTIPE